MNVTNAEQALKSYCKTKGYEKPIYTIVSRDSTQLDDGTFRFKHYVCAVQVNGQFLANGDGFSKRIARKKAAMFGLQNLRIIEMSQLFQMFKTHVPLPQIEYTNREGHKKSILSLFQPSVQIEEISSIENGRSQPIPSAPIQSTSLIENDEKQQQQQQSGSENEQLRRNSDPSEELILAAIAKLRSISFKSPGENDNDEEEEEENKMDDAKDENLANKHRKQMKEISEEITHLNLADQISPNRDAIPKDPEKQGIESLLYIEDHANVPERSFRKFRKPPPPVPKRKYFGPSKQNSKQIFKI